MALLRRGGRADLWCWTPSVCLLVLTTLVLGCGGPRFVDIDAGSSCTCGITTGGEILCWGYQEDEPGSCVAPTGSSYVSIDVGYSQACAITEAGKIVCWGRVCSEVMGFQTLLQLVFVPVLVLAFAARAADTSLDRGQTAELVSLYEGNSSEDVFVDRLRAMMSEPSGNVMAMLYVVFQESIEQQNEDKRAMLARYRRLQRRVPAP